MSKYVIWAVLLFGLLAGPAFAQTSVQVNTTASQTLSNKTLTAPIINGGSLTGTISGGATYSGITLPSPSITGIIGGSPTFPAPGDFGLTTPRQIKGTTITSTECVIVITLKICSGSGSPESVVTAAISSIYLRTNGATGQQIYIKVSGSGTTGWQPFAAAFRLAPLVPTYGANVTINVDNGKFQIVRATNTSVFQIDNPTGDTIADGDVLTISIENRSGGTLGIITFDTQFKLATFTKPADTKNRKVTFLRHDSIWDEINCSPEIPNGTL